MFKKNVFYLFMIMILVPNFVFASVNSLVMIGGKYYDSLEEAILNVNSNEIIKLISDVKLDDTISINKTVNIDLNGKNIVGTSRVFEVDGGVLNVSGNGIIKESKPNYGAIVIIGSTDSLDNNYSIVNVGKNVKLEGWSGIFVTHNSSKSYSVVVNLDGDINAVNDINGDSGIGIYINGNIKHESNSPVINIGDDVEITSTGTGVYVAGYSTFNIGHAYISGKEAGIGIKAGTLNIDGATVFSDGKDNTPTSGYNNGIKASGTAIQIESNNGYAGNIKINIDSGSFRSRNSYSIYEYIGRGTTTQVESFDISGGTFRAEGNKDVFGLSDSFKSTINNFISGGNYTSDPSDYLKAGYTTTLDGDLYKVINSSVKLVSGNSVDNSSLSGVSIILTVIFVILLGLFIVYLKRDKLFLLFRK